MATASLAGPVGKDSPTNIYRALPTPIYVDNPGDLELANKLGLNTAPTGGQRGLPVCPNVLTDATNCHPADLTLGANFSGAAPGSFRTMDNFTPTAGNPTRLCWIGRYANRVDPVANESFLITIYADDAGLPDLAAGPIYQETFTQGGGGCSADWDNSGGVNSNDISAFLTSWLADVANMTTFADFDNSGMTNSNDISAFLTAWLAQVGGPCTGGNVLELSCLDGDTCPGTTAPVAGGHWVFSAEEAAGFPLAGGGCYWIEIANVASNAAGTNWGWVGSNGGTDLFSLQAIDGAYNVFTRVAGDRAFCFSGGLSPFLGNCTIAPLPPVCTNDPANGIPDVGGLNNGFRASSPGSVGRVTAPGAWTPFQRAENFQFAAATSVSSVCFGGFWLGVTDAGVTVGIAAPSAPAFNVTYWGETDGFPGLVPLADFTTGQPGVTLNWDGSNVSNVMHPAVNFAADTCYFVSVGRVQSQQAIGAPVNPLWHWFLTNSSNTTGDDLIYSRAVGPVGAWGSFTLVPTNPSNLWFLLSNGPTEFADCEPPPPPPPPANDLCANAVALTQPTVGNPTTVSGTTLGALNDNMLACGTATAQSAGGVWYTVTGTGGQMTASMCSSPAPAYDGQIHILTGGCGAEACLTGDDDGCGSVGGPSIASWASVSGQTYFIMVHGWGGDSGNFELVVSTQ